MESYIAKCGSDWYYTEKLVYVDKRLDRMPYAQAGTRFENGEVRLISYDTLVCWSDHGFIGCNGTFSATTRKHIQAWLREFYPVLSYYDMKYCDLYNCCIKFDGKEITSNETAEVFDTWEDAKRDYKARHKD